MYLGSVFQHTAAMFILLLDDPYIIISREQRSDSGNQRAL